jgi:hypothetical protein
VLAPFYITVGKLLKGTGKGLHGPQTKNVRPVLKKGSKKPRQFYRTGALERLEDPEMLPRWVTCFLVLVIISGGFLYVFGAHTHRSINMDTPSDYFYLSHPTGFSGLCGTARRNWPVRRRTPVEESAEKIAELIN